MAIAKAKFLIIREMVLKDKSQIAEEYIKRTLLHFSSNFPLLADLLVQYSKIIKTHYPSNKIERSVYFMIELVKKSSIAVPDSLFTNLIVFVQINVSNKAS